MSENNGFDLKDLPADLRSAVISYLHKEQQCRTKAERRAELLAQELDGLKREKAAQQEFYFNAIGDKLELIAALQQRIVELENGGGS